MAFKGDFILSIIFNMAFFYVYFAIWKNIYSTGDINNIADYTLKNTITYYFITSLIYRLDLTNSLYMNWEVWTGYFTNYLMKPASITLNYLMQTLGDVSVTFILYIPFAAFIYLTVSKYMSFPTGLYWLYFAITLVLMLAMSFFINMIMHSLVFKFGDQENNISLVNYLIGFLAGGFFPLAFLGGKISTLFHLLPFKYLFDFPCNIFLMKIPPVDIFYGWAMMAIWILIFYFISKIIFQKGLKHYTGTGR